MIGQLFIDYFKLFKIFQLKKLEKTGQVKIIQDKILMRKVLSIQGTISTQNFTSLNCSNHPNIHFRHKYLYFLCFCDPGKHFNFQITYYLSSKQYKIICSTSYKEEFKKKSDNQFLYQLKMPMGKWTVLAIDLYSLVNWEGLFKSQQDIRLGFRISNIELRASSKIRGIFQVDTLYGPNNMPKDMQLPIKNQENFFEKYAYTVIGLNMSEQIKKQIQSFQQFKQQIGKFQKSINKQSIEKSKLHTSLKKQNDFNEKNTQSRQKITKKEASKSVQKIKKPSIPSNKNKIDNKRKQNLKNKNTQENNTLSIQNDQQQQPQQQILLPPKPAASINLKFTCIQALSVVNQNIISCQSFLIQPVFLQTHKKINKIFKSRLGKVLTAYNDGSICLWDTIRKQSMFYFRSQLEQIKCLLMDYEQNIIIVGLDKLKREVIEIVSDQAIIFKQISTFNIKGIKLISQDSFELGMISYGYQNIRIWSISPNNNIINGTSIYLGKLARNITYNDCCLIQTIAGVYAFICDTQGYVTKINIGEKKMEGVVKVDGVGIDHIKFIKVFENEQKLLICNQKGTMKLLNCTTMECQLEYPINQRVKSLFLKHNSALEVHNESSQSPIVIIQTYKKTILQLNLLTSSIHFNVRSHYQPITNIIYSKPFFNNGCKNNPNFLQNRIITSGLDSTLRIWKGIRLSQSLSQEEQQQCELIFKEQYQFLINGEVITHIQTALTKNNDNKRGQCVYVITDANKIRKIHCGSYEILKEKNIPNIIANEFNNKNQHIIDSNKIVSFSINNQGKYLLILSNSQFLILDQQLEIFSYKNLQQQSIKHRKINKIKNQDKKYVSGFNSYKKSFYFLNPITNNLQFYSLKDLNKPQFVIKVDYQSQQILNIQYHNNIIHILTHTQYQLYQNQSLLRIIPLSQTSNNNQKLRINSIQMNYPLICKSITNLQTNQNFIQLRVLNKNGLIERIKLPQKVNCIQMSKPEIKANKVWTGEIVCAGVESCGVYVLGYSLLNVAENFMNQNEMFMIDEQENQYYDQNNNVSFNNSYNQQRLKINNELNPNNKNNLMDISFSQNGTIINQYPSFLKTTKGMHIVNPQFSYNQKEQQPPRKLKKLYQQEQKIFQQCKNVIFGNFFQQDKEKKKGNNNAIQNDDQQNQFLECQDQFNEQENNQIIGNGKDMKNIKIKLFFGYQSRQCLNNITANNNNLQSNPALCQFYWSSSHNLMSLLTNQHHSLLIHQFSSPKIHQKLIHLYSKPTSICWSFLQPQPQSNSSIQINYYIVCFNSIMKLYNANNKFAYIRNIQIEMLIKDNHVIFSSFVTNCNGYIVLATYRRGKEGEKGKGKGDIRKDQKNNINNKLYIFVIQISTSKIISSSYRQLIKLPQTYSKNPHLFEKHITQNFSIQVNRYTNNKQLQFILKSPNQLAFYRVTSMSTLQTLQLEEINLITKEKTEGILCAKYIKIENDVYLLLGTEIGALIIIDARSGAVVLVLMNILEGRGNNGKSKSSAIIAIQFIQQKYNLQQNIFTPSKLILFCSNSNTIKIFTLQNGLNTLIQQLEQNDSNISFSQLNFSQNPSFTKINSHLIKKQSQQHCTLLNLDNQIHSISFVNNSTQQLIITKSCTLWLIDYQDYCTVKVFSGHEQRVNEVLFLEEERLGGQNLSLMKSDYGNNNNQGQYQLLNNTNNLFISCSSDGYVKITTLSKCQQTLQLYKPRKNATCLSTSHPQYLVCGFKNQLYFYNHPLSQNSPSLKQNQQYVQNCKDLKYLGSLQFENNDQIIIKVINISQSDNFYVLTERAVYVIYVRRRREDEKGKGRETGNSMYKNSNYSQMLMSRSSTVANNNFNNNNTNIKTLQKISIKIQISQITSFSHNVNFNKNPNNSNQSTSTPLSLIINPYKPYDQFCIIYKNKVDTWQRKCLKRSLNPLQQLAKVQQLEYYLIDVYQRKDIVGDVEVQFVAESQYFITLPQLSKLQHRKFLQHSIIHQITLSKKQIPFITAFKYLNNNNNKNINTINNNNNSFQNKNQYFLKKGVILLIGDKNGYLNICDINGLVLDKEKVFNTAIEMIETRVKRGDKGRRKVEVLVKSGKYISVVELKGM